MGVLLLLSGPAAITGAIELLFAYGAWTLRSWAWVLGVVGSALALLQADIAIALAILAYLNTSTVRHAFGRERSRAADQ